ncbi:MAG: acyl dehydratase [Burkholderiales bacterium]|nr:acyl dehydratase [Burkholderiales bacterium]
MSAAFLRELESAAVDFDDLAVGDRFVTAARTVTEADIVAFAGLSGDFNQLHTDAEFAAATPHGKRIAHGLLVLSIMSGLCTRLPVNRFMERAIIGLAGLEAKWLRPVFIGDTLHVVVEVVAKTPSRKPGRGTVGFRRSAVNQAGQTVLETTWAIVMSARGAAGAA